MTTASSYFTGPKPMFGPDGFAREATPKETFRAGECVLRQVKQWNVQRFFWCNGPACIEPCSDLSALALCEKAAQGWIRSKGYEWYQHRNGAVTLHWGLPPDGYEQHTIEPLNGSPDWRRAAEWVNEQENR